MDLCKTGYLALCLWPPSRIRRCWPFHLTKTREHGWHLAQGCGQQPWKKILMPFVTSQGADLILQFLKMDHAEEVEWSLCRHLASWCCHQLRKGSCTPFDVKKGAFPEATHFLKTGAQSRWSKNETRHLIGPSSCLDEDKSKARWTCWRRTRAHRGITEGWFQFIKFSEKWVKPENLKMNFWLVIDTDSAKKTNKQKKLICHNVGLFLFLQMFVVARPRYRWIPEKKGLPAWGTRRTTTPSALQVKAKTTFTATVGAFQLPWGG